MKMIKNIFLFTAGVILLCYCNVFCQADELLDRAVKEYLRGDYAGAIQDFERVLEMEDNEKAKKLLNKSLLEEAKRQINLKKYEEAKINLEKSLEISPEDTEAKKLLNNVKEYFKKEATEKEKEQKNTEKLLEKVVDERKEKESFKNRANVLRRQKKKIEKELNEYKEKLKENEDKIAQLTEHYEKKRKGFNTILLIGMAVILVFGIVLIIILLRLYAVSNDGQYQLDELQEKLTAKIKESEEERKSLEERLARSINNMIDGQKNVVGQMSQSIAGKAQNDIENIRDSLEKNFEIQQNNLIELLNQQVKAMSNEKTEKIELGDRVITDINPHIRARADSVELIPKTISDPNVAEKILRPYLNDPNNRVRANACVAIFQYNPELSLDTLKKMADSPDKWMRLSAAWAAGEVSSPEVIHVLRKLLDDVEERVKNRAIMTFEKLAEVKDDVAEEIRRLIDESKNS